MADPPLSTIDMENAVSQSQTLRPSRPSSANASGSTYPQLRALSQRHIRGQDSDEETQSARSPSRSGQTPEDIDNGFLARTPYNGSHEADVDMSALDNVADEDREDAARELGIDLSNFPQEPEDTTRIRQGDGSNRVIPDLAQGSVARSGTELHLDVFVPVDQRQNGGTAYRHKTSYFRHITDAEDLKSRVVRVPEKWLDVLDNAVLLYNSACEKRDDFDKEAEKLDQLRKEANERADAANIEAADLLKKVANKDKKIEQLTTLMARYRNERNLARNDLDEQKDATIDAKAEMRQLLAKVAQLERSRPAPSSKDLQTPPETDHHDGDLSEEEFATALNHQLPRGSVRTVKTTRRIPLRDDRSTRTTSPALRTTRSYVASHVESDDEDSEAHVRTSRRVTKKAVRRAVTSDDSDRDEVHTFRTKAPKLPTAFSGEHKKDEPPFPEWKQKMEFCMSMDREHSRKDKVRIVVNNTTGPAYDNLAPGVSDFRDYHAVLKDMEDQWGDRFKDKKKQEEFKQLRQGAQDSFDSFWTKFNGYRPYLKKKDDAELQEELLDKLNEDFFRYVGNIVFDSIHDMKDHLRGIEAKIMSRRLAHGKPVDGTSSTAGKGKKTATAGDYAAAASSEQKGGRPKKSLEQMNKEVKDAYDWAAVGQNFKPISQELYDNRSACFACKGTDHKTRFDTDCPLQKFRKTRNRRNQPPQPTNAAADVQRDEAGAPPSYHDQLKE